MPKKQKKKSDLSRAFSEDGELKTHVGGQALIEGIMMRGRYNWAVAIREPDGNIYTEEHDLASGKKKNSWMYWPVVRGCTSMVESLAIGYQALSISMEHAYDEDAETYGSLKKKAAEEAAAAAEGGAQVEEDSEGGAAAEGDADSAQVESGTQVEEGSEGGEAAGAESGAAVELVASDAGLGQAKGAATEHDVAAAADAAMPAEPACANDLAAENVLADSEAIEPAELAAPAEEEHVFSWKDDFGRPDTVIDALCAQRTLEVVSEPDVPEQAGQSVLAGEAAQADGSAELAAGASAAEDAQVVESAASAQRSENFSASASAAKPASASESSASAAAAVAAPAANSSTADVSSAAAPLAPAVASVAAAPAASTPVVPSNVKPDKKEKKSKQQKEPKSSAASKSSSKSKSTSKDAAGEEKKSFWDEDAEFSETDMMISMVIGVVLGLVLFIVGPAVITNLIVGEYDSNSLLWNICDGLLRVGVFILYIWLIGRMSDIKRMFSYHGAEHKTIHCYEHGLPLTPENARSFPRLHVRCGTAFLIMVMIIAILVYTITPLDWLIDLLGVPDGAPKLILVVVVRILLLPLIAGISYEITVKWAGNHPENPLVKVVLWPGLQMQYLTTNEPDDEMLECAITAMQMVLDREEKEAAKAKRQARAKERAKRRVERERERAAAQLQEPGQTPAESGQGPAPESEPAYDEAPGQSPGQAPELGSASDRASGQRSAPEAEGSPAESDDGLAPEPAKSPEPASAPASAPASQALDQSGLAAAVAVEGRAMAGAN